MIIAHKDVVAIRNRAGGKIHFNGKSNGKLWETTSCLRRIDHDKCDIHNPEDMDMLKSIMSDKRFCKQCHTNTVYWLNAGDGNESTF